MYRHLQLTEQYVQCISDQLAFRYAQSASVLNF